MNSTGCGFLLLASLALLVSLVPFLAWTNLVIALPMALVAFFTAANQARRPAAQPVDKTVFWIVLALIALIVVRSVVS